MKHAFYEKVICPKCGESNKLNTSFRWAGDRWEHRCPDVDPQVGHWPMETDKGNWASEPTKEEQP